MVLDLDLPSPLPHIYSVHAETGVSRMTNLRCTTADSPLLKSQISRPVSRVLIILSLETPLANERVFQGKK